MFLSLKRWVLNIPRWNSCTYTIIWLGILDVSIWMALGFFTRDRHAIKNPLKNQRVKKKKAKQKKNPGQWSSHVHNKFYTFTFVSIYKKNHSFFNYSFNIFLFEELRTLSYYKYFKQWLWFHFQCTIRSSTVSKFSIFYCLFL